MRRGDPRPRRDEGVSPLIEELTNATGALCELRTERNDLIYLARVQACDGNTIVLEQSSGKEVPPVIYNTKVKLTIRTGGSVPVVVFGMVCGSTRLIWKVDRLDRFKYEEQRTVFRQKISVSARLLHMGSDDDFSKHYENRNLPTTPCVLTDISLGGTMLNSSQRFALGDWLMLKDVQLLPNDPPFVFYAKIFWADLKGPRVFRYGCGFGELSEREQDRLCGRIFQLQRIDLKRNSEDD